MFSNQKVNKLYMLLLFLISFILLSLLRTRDLGQLWFLRGLLLFWTSHSFSSVWIVVNSKIIKPMCVFSVKEIWAVNKGFISWLSGLISSNRVCSSSFDSCAKSKLCILNQAETKLRASARNSTSIIQNLLGRNPQNESKPGIKAQRKETHAQLTDKKSSDSLITIKQVNEAELLWMKLDTRLIYKQRAHYDIDVVYFLFHFLQKQEIPTNTELNKRTCAVTNRYADDNVLHQLQTQHTHTHCPLL